MTWRSGLWAHLESERRRDLSDVRGWLVALAVVGAALVLWGSR